MADQAMQTLTTEIEKELLHIIIKNLDQATMTIDQTRTLAQAFMSLLPLQDKQDLLNKLYKLELAHGETKSLYLQYAAPIEEEERQRKITLMSQHIKNGQIEHAIAVAKGGIPDA